MKKRDMSVVITTENCNSTDNNEDEILIEGVCTLESQSNDYDGTYLTHNEMQEIVKTVVGVPFLRDHNEKDRIGTIKAAKIDKNNRLYICASINRDNFTSINAINEMKEGLLNGLSIGSECTIYKNQSTGKFKALDKKIPEISVVKYPDLDHARIKFISNDNEKFTKKKNDLLNIINYNKNLKNYNLNLFNKLDLINNNKLNCDQTTKKLMASESEKVENSSSMNKKEEEEFKLQGPPETQEEKPQEIKKPHLELPKDPEKLQEYLQHLLNQNSEKDKLLKQYETNPEEIKKLKEDKLAKEAKWAKRMEEKSPELIEWIISNAEREGIDPKNLDVQLIIDTLKNAKDDARRIKPMFNVLATAHAATMKSQSEQEKMYQALKSETDKELKSVKQTAKDNDAKWSIYVQSVESDQLNKNNLKRVQQSAPQSSGRQSNYNTSEYTDDKTNKKVKTNEEPEYKDISTGRSILDYGIPEQYGNVTSPLADHIGVGVFSGGTEFDQRKIDMLDAIKSNQGPTTGHQDMGKSGIKFSKNLPRGHGFDPDTGEMTFTSAYSEFN